MRVVLCLALSTLAFADDSDVVLPPPPPNFSALAQAEYQKAEQAFYQHDWLGAEKALNASWAYQHHRTTLYDLAAVHLHQRRFEEAMLDMIQYFVHAPPAAQDTNNVDAKKRVRRIAFLMGHAGRSGREYARETITSIKAGHYSNANGRALDRALDETQDLALYYWIVLREYRTISPNYSPRARGLNTLLASLKVYFDGSEDLTDVFAACQLMEEIKRDYKRSVVLEKNLQMARRGR